VERVFAAKTVAGNPIPPALLPGQILKHVRLGPSATMIRTSLMRSAYAEWHTSFADIPFEIFLTIRLLRDIPPDANPPPAPTQPPAAGSGKDPVLTRIVAPAGMGVCRTQDWGWNL
jgi:hypothetical protein